MEWEGKKRKADPSKTRDDSGFRGGIYFYHGFESVSDPARHRMNMFSDEQWTSFVNAHEAT